MPRKNFYAKVNQRITTNLDQRLRQEAKETNEALADVVRNCLDIGLAHRRKPRESELKQTPF